MIFDTHAHYDDKQFDQDREELLASMKDNGIGTIVDVGSNMETSTYRWGGYVCKRRYSSTIYR